MFLFTLTYSFRFSIHDAPCVRPWPLVWLFVAAFCNLTLLNKSSNTVIACESQTGVRVANQCRPSSQNMPARYTEKWHIWLNSKQSETNRNGRQMLKRAVGGLLTEFQRSHTSHYCTSVCLAGRSNCVPRQLPTAAWPTFNMLDCPAERGRRTSSAASAQTFKTTRLIGWTKSNGLGNARHVASAVISDLIFHIYMNSGHVKADQAFCHAKNDSLQYCKWTVVPLYQHFIIIS